MRTDDHSTSSQARQILADIGELPNAPTPPASKIPPPSPVQPSRAERAPIRLEAVQALVGSGNLTPDQLPLLGPVFLAPGIPVDSARLRWHRGRQCLGYQTPNGGFVRLDRVARLLNLGDDDAAAWCVTSIPGPPDPNAPDGAPRARYQRLSIELGTMLYVYQAAPADIANSADGSAGGFGQTLPDGAWIAMSEYGEYRLVDVQLGVRAWFDSAEEAMVAADAGVLGEPLAATEVIEGVTYEAEPRHYYWLQAAVPAHVLRSTEGI